MPTDHLDDTSSTATDETRRKAKRHIVLSAAERKAGNRARAEGGSVSPLAGATASSNSLLSTYKGAGEEAPGAGVVAVEPDVTPASVLDDAEEILRLKTEGAQQESRSRQASESLESLGGGEAEEALRAAREVIASYEERQMVSERLVRSLENRMMHQAAREQVLVAKLRKQIEELRSGEAEPLPAVRARVRDELEQARLEAELEVLHARHAELEAGNERLRAERDAARRATEDVERREAKARRRVQRAAAAVHEEAARVRDELRAARGALSSDVPRLAAEAVAAGLEEFFGADVVGGGRAGDADALTAAPSQFIPVGGSGQWVLKSKEAYAEDFQVFAALADGVREQATAMLEAAEAAVAAADEGDGVGADGNGVLGDEDEAAESTPPPHPPPPEVLVSLDFLQRYSGFVPAARGLRAAEAARHAVTAVGHCVGVVQPALRARVEALEAELARLQLTPSEKEELAELRCTLRHQEHCISELTANLVFRSEELEAAEQRAQEAEEQLATELPSQCVPLLQTRQSMRIIIRLATRLYIAQTRERKLRLLVGESHKDQQRNFTEVIKEVVHVQRIEAIAEADEEKKPPAPAPAPQKRVPPSGALHKVYCFRCGDGPHRNRGPCPTCKTVLFYGVNIAEEKKKFLIEEYERTLRKWVNGPLREERERERQREREAAALVSMRRQQLALAAPSPSRRLDPNPPLALVPAPPQQPLPPPCVLFAPAPPRSVGTQTHGRLHPAEQHVAEKPCHLRQLTNGAAELLLLACRDPPGAEPALPPPAAAAGAADLRRWWQGDAVPSSAAAADEQVGCYTRSRACQDGIVPESRVCLPHRTPAQPPPVVPQQPQSAAVSAAVAVADARALPPGRRSSCVDPPPPQPQQPAGAGAARASLRPTQAHLAQQGGRTGARTMVAAVAVAAATAARVGGGGVGPERIVHAARPPDALQAEKRLRLGSRHYRTVAGPYPFQQEVGLTPVTESRDWLLTPPQKKKRDHLGGGGGGGGLKPARAAAEKPGSAGVVAGVGEAATLSPFGTPHGTPTAAGRKEVFSFAEYLSLKGAPGGSGGAAAASTRPVPVAARDRFSSVQCA